MKQDEKRRNQGYRTQLSYFKILPKLGTIYPQLHIENQIAQRSVLVERPRPRGPQP